MANLIIAPQPAQASVEASPAHFAKALPADTKIAGKTAEEMSQAGKNAADAFSANLKEELANQAKKEAQKKAVPVTAISPISSALVKNANVLETAGQANAVLDLKNSKELGEATGKTHPDLKHADQVAHAKINGKFAANTLVETQADPKSKLAAATVPESGPAKGEPTPLKNLTPLQQVLLSEQVAAQKTAMNPQNAGGAFASPELAEALQAMTIDGSEFSHDFEVESLTSGKPAFAKTASLKGSDVLSEKRASASKVSTSDFLDLRNLAKTSPASQFNANSQTSLDLGTGFKGKDGKKDSLQSLGGREAFAGTLGNSLEVGRGKVIDAPVTQGSAGKNVLSHDAIHQMTSQVNLLSEARQDGEIKIRLRPDHLGELQMSVKTQGQQVSIEFKAQNSESKKIIEDSLATLKESLGQQNLTLARVDVVNAPAHAQNVADQGMQMDMGQFRQNSGHGSDRGFDQGSVRSDLRYEEMSAPVNLNTVRQAGINARAGQGLDLIA